MRRFVNVKRKLFWTAVVALVIGIFALLRVPCFYKALLGVSCLGCGMTRAWAQVLRGNLAAAFSFHPLFWTVPLLYLYVLTDGHLLGKPWLDRLVLALLLGSFGVLGLLRLLVPALWV